MKEKIATLYTMALERIEKVHIACFRGMEKPLFLISEQYPGLWLEHVYDSVLLAQLEPRFLQVAENAIHLFIDYQTAEGQLPFSVMDLNKQPHLREDEMARFSQIQECVSFFSLAYEVYELNRDPAFLEKIYRAGKKWDEWLRSYRMTTGRGLVEMFVGFDTGHDNSGRLEGMGCKQNYVVDGVAQNACVLPPEDSVTPILAVDMNCNFFAHEMALARMADALGRTAEGDAWRASAGEIKEKLFAHCYNEEDDFFYDVDKTGNQRKYKSCALFHLFMEKVLDREADSELIARIYEKHIKNPREFWTAYPFPSMALDDPSTEGHPEFNCWGYYTQGLTVLRCSRWMDHYGFGEDYDHILRQWILAWTEHFDTIPFAQEIDPITGVPTKSSSWYSSCMLNYIYGARRLGLVAE